MVCVVPSRLFWVFLLCFLFFFNDTATTEIYTLSLHDALPIWRKPVRAVISGSRAALQLPSSSGVASGLERSRKITSSRAGGSSSLCDDTGTGARRGVHADLANLGDEAGIGRELGRRPFGAAGSDEGDGRERGKSDTFHGASSRRSRGVAMSKMRMRVTMPGRCASTSRTCTALRSSPGRYRIQLPAGA